MLRLQTNKFANIDIKKQLFKLQNLTFFVRKKSISIFHFSHFALFKNYSNYDGNS